MGNLHKVVVYVATALHLWCGGLTTTQTPSTKGEK